MLFVGKRYPKDILLLFNFTLKIQSLIPMRIVQHVIFVFGAIIFKIWVVNVALFLSTIAEFSLDALKPNVHFEDSRICNLGWANTLIGKWTNTGYHIHISCIHRKIAEKNLVNVITGSMFCSIWCFILRATSCQSMKGNFGTKSLYPISTSPDKTVNTSSRPTQWFCFTWYIG